MGALSNIFNKKGKGLLDSFKADKDYQVTAFEINNPKSLRTYSYNQDSPDKVVETIGIQPSLTKEMSRLGVVDSTAIKSARYDPSDDSLNIVYKDNPKYRKINGSSGKEYKFKAGGAEGLREWLEAPSKGRITRTWRDTHRYPGY